MRHDIWCEKWSDNIFWINDSHRQDFESAPIDEPNQLYPISIFHVGVIYPAKKKRKCKLCKWNRIQNSWMWWGATISCMTLVKSLCVCVYCRCVALTSPIIQNSCHSTGPNLICVLFEVLSMVSEDFSRHRFYKCIFFFCIHDVFSTDTEFSGNVNAALCLMLASHHSA